MPLSFPQHIKIKNPRLQVLSTLLYFFVAACLVVRFVVFRRYGRKLPVHGAGNVLVEGLENATRMHEIGHSKLSEAFCSAPNAYDFWYDAFGDLRYENHTCLQVCTNEISNTSHRCLRSMDLAVPEGPQSVVLVTHIQETNSQAATTKNYFVPSVDALGIRLTFTYSVPWLHWYQVVQVASQETPHSSRYDVQTVVVDSSGKHWRTFVPGTDPRLSLHDLLLLSGTQSLDAHQRLAGRNFYPNAAPAVAEAGPVGRISGMQLTLRLQCGNVRESYINVDFGQHKNTCFLLIQPTETWVSTGARFIDNGNRRNYRGVRIKLAVEGYFWTPDVNAIFVNIASSIVIFQLPHSVVFFIAVWCCGHISFIYRHLIYKRFSIANEAGAMAMRLLEHEVAFNDLGHPINGHVGEISREAVSNSIHHIMERRGHSLDERELQRMVDFCLDRVTSAFRGAEKELVSGIHMMISDALDGVSNFYWDVKEAFGVKVSELVDVDAGIDVDKFASACSSAEPITFDSLIKLFDQDRKRSWLETFFTPQTLSQCLTVEKYGSESATTSNPSNEHNSHSWRRSVSIRNHVSDLVSRAELHHRTLEDLTQMASEHVDTISDLSGQIEALCNRIQNLEQQLSNVEARSLPQPQQSEKSDAVSSKELDQQISGLTSRMETRIALVEQNFNSKLERSLASLSSEISCPREETNASGLPSQYGVDARTPCPDAQSLHEHSVGSDPTSEHPEEMALARQPPTKKNTSSWFAAPTTLYSLEVASSALRSIR